MAAVLQDPIDIDIFNVIRAEEDVVECGFRVFITGRVVALREKVVHPLRVNDPGFQVDDVFAELDMLLDRRIAVLEIADGAGRDDDQQRRDPEEPEDLGAQGYGAGLAGAHLGQHLDGKRGLLPGIDAEGIKEALRQELDHGEDRQTDDQLVQEVENEVRGELGQERLDIAGVELRGQRGGDAAAEIHPVEQPGDDAAERAAQKGKHNDGDDQLPELLEETFPIEEHRGEGDQNVQRAIVSRAGIGEAVDQIRDKPDGDPGQKAAHNGGQDRADRVQKDRERKRLRETGAEKVDQDADDDESGDIVKLRFADRRRLLQVFFQKTHLLFQVVSYL